MNLHFPDLDPRPRSRDRIVRQPVAAWMLLAIAGAILGAALVAAAMTPDARLFAGRHPSAPIGARAL